MSTMTCPTNPPGHNWQAGLTCRWCHATRTPGEAVLSGLASVRGWTPEAARTVRDAYRAEVLAAHGEAYDGQLVMLTGLVATLQAVVEHGDLAEVRKLLAEHDRGDAEAREKSSPTGADATPDFVQPGHTYTRPEPHLRGPETGEPFAWKFLVTSLSTSPTGGRAVHGHRTSNTTPVWEPYSVSELGWLQDDWTDVTEDGDRDA